MSEKRPERTVRTAGRTARRVSPKKDLHQRKGKFQKKPKKLDASSLDKELDGYMMRNEETAKSKLDDDLDQYMMEIEK